MGPGPIYGTVATAEFWCVYWGERVGKPPPCLSFCIFKELLRQARLHHRSVQNFVADYQVLSRPGRLRWNGNWSLAIVICGRRLTIPWIHPRFGRTKPGRLAYGMLSPADRSRISLTVPGERAQSSLPKGSGSAPTLLGRDIDRRSCAAAI